MASNSEAATQIFETAISKLRQTVSPADALAFRLTHAEDVWKAAEVIQNIQRERKSLWNMRRIEPFLQALGKYSTAVDVLCNGTPYLPWIWAPVKLMLQLAADHRNVFDKLIDAYSQIADAMPQIARLQGAFGDNSDFRVVLAMVYEDILEFHRRAYKFFRRRSWQVFFDSLWKDFQARLQGILKRLIYHRDHLMKEAAVIDIVNAHEFRVKARQEIIAQEKQTRALHLHDSLSWLKIATEKHDDDLERLSEKRQEGTCEWVSRNPHFQTWKGDVHGNPVLWVKGIPGAGKTILSTYVIKYLQEQGGVTTAYHICNSHTTGKNLLSDILRSIADQLLRANLDLAPYIFDNYANKGLAPSVVRLRKLIPELIGTVSSVRIIIDGLDEYPEHDQRAILTDLLSLSKSPGGNCRVLFSNRESTLISRTLGGKPTISLRDQDVDISSDIRLHVHARLKEFRALYGNHLINKIEEDIVSKADGMFLWVRLVMQSLDKCGSSQELSEAVDTLPKGLHKAYGRILHDIHVRDSVKAIRILQWIACSFRLLKKHEIQDGIVLQQNDVELNERTKLVDGFLEQCKPLIEEGPKNTVDFVHYSAKEYILDEASGPFLHYYEAHHGLAFSCIKYMKSSHCFISPDCSEDARRLRVLKGFHGLHHYANEFWFQHLLQYVKSEKHVEDDELDVQVEDLEEFFWKRSPEMGAKSLKMDDTTSADGIETQLEILAIMPQAQGMGLDILTFRKFLSQEKYSHKNPESLKDDEIRFDPTRFSEISQNYQRIVRFLMNCTADQIPEGAQPFELEKFRQTYLDLAYTCRYRECPRSSDGFKSVIERDEHEQLHAKPLRCADPSCEFFARGFTSKTGLSKHNKKYHPLPEEIEVPNFEPRREPEPQYISPPPPAPEPAPVPQRVLTPPPPPPPEEIEEEPPERYRPQKTRVSRAKKGLPVHICEIDGKVFTRAEGLRRHKLIHAPPQFHCSWVDCRKSFYRSDLLERHEDQHERQLQTGNSHQSTVSRTPDEGEDSTLQREAGHLSQSTPISVQSLLS